MQGYEPNTALRLIALARNPPPPCTEKQLQQLRGLSFAFCIDGASEAQRALNCCDWSWGEPLPWEDFTERLICARLRYTTPIRLCSAGPVPNRSAGSVPLLAALLGDANIEGLAQLAPAFPDGRLPPVRSVAAGCRCSAAPPRASRVRAQRRALRAD
jgi:hypothetical protein